MYIQSHDKTKVIKFKGLYIIELLEYIGCSCGALYSDDCRCQRARPSGKYSISFNNEIYMRCTDKASAHAVRQCIITRLHLDSSRVFTVPVADSEEFSQFDCWKLQEAFDIY
jgi:hypothetical protein